MTLPTCWSCGYAFKWKELFVFVRRKKCPTCQHTQYVTTESHWRMSMGAVLLPLFMFIFNVLNLHWVWEAFIMIILLMVYFAMVPFLLKFTDKDQPLF